MQETVLLNVPISDFRLIVIDAVNSCLLENDKVPAKLPNRKEIISRDELCKRLSITEPTAIRWEKKGVIPCFRIGSSVRYNWDEVITALENKRRA